MAKKTAKKAAAKKGEKKARKPGIGALARECIAKGMDFEAAQKVILKQFPDSKISKASYAWYKTKMQPANKGPTE